MPIVEIQVARLFGELNHDIAFNPEGLTIVHGPNGVGKTTILKLVFLLFEERFAQVSRMPFQSITIRFDDSSSLSVVREPAESQKLPAKLHFSLKNDLETNHASFTWTEPEAQLPGLSAVLEDYIDELSQTGPSAWADSSTGQTIGLAEALETYSDRIPPYFPRRGEQELPPWLSDALRAPISFVKTERLSTTRARRPGRPTRDPGPHVPAVVTYARAMVREIRTTLAEYGEVSQDLDSTFPTRLLDQQAKATGLPSQAEIQEHYEKQAVRRARYVDTGLLDEGNELKLPDREIEEYERRVLALYLDDVDQKLDQLERLANRLELFLKIVNGKFRRKSVTISRKKGLEVKSLTGHDLNLPELSSGEQQEIVLAYELLFNDKDGSLILIDEPELSLHVSWQMGFIPDLLKIAGLTGMYFLVATHSPQIVNDRWDLTSELGDSITDS